MFSSSRPRLGCSIAILSLLYRMVMSTPPDDILPESSATYDIIQTAYEWGPDCYGDIEVSPRSMARRLGNGKTLSSYPDMQRLCAAAQWGGDPESNIGAVCVVLPVAPPSPGVVTGEPYGDPRLYNVDSLRLKCLELCVCDLPAGWTPEWLTAATKASVLRGVAPREQPDEGQQIISSNDFVFVNKDGTIGGQIHTCSINGAHKCVDAQFSGSGICHGSCDGLRCDKSGKEGCVCIASRPNLIHGAFTALGCGFIQAARRGKLRGREIEDGIGCPCNMSYVSRSCCYSESKMVWEKPERKLGTVMIDGPEFKGEATL